MSTNNQTNDTARYFSSGCHVPSEPEERRISHLLPDIGHINREILNLTQRVNKLEKVEDKSGRLAYLEKENQRLQYERDAYHAKVLALVDYIAGTRDE
jgi:hypothetical protein